MFKRILTTLIVIVLFICFSNSSYGEDLTLPNGQVLNIDKLNDAEISQAIKTARKSMEGQKSAKSVLNMVKGVDPTELEAWSKLISGTIKTVCNDLSITVNDFVKTPVGIGIAALIAYRVAGAEILDNALDIIIMVPLWFLMTSIILFLGWYFFSGKTVYEKIGKTTEGKTFKEGVKRVSRYPWEKVDKHDTSPKIIFACVLIAAEILGTFLTLCIVLI